jgi:uncharacterized membrane protein
MATSHASTPTYARQMQTFGNWLSNHWFGAFLVIYGVWVFTPFLAPLFMHAGWELPGKIIYSIYSFFCHQLPERSFFFYGPKSMYSLAEIQVAWQQTDNPMVLRQFIGSQAMGWKVAWSDRMISFYTSLWFFALAWWPMRRRFKPLSWGVLILLLLPIALDGSTHAFSDIAGIGQGFRDSNQWLAALTNNALPASFYAGDALGSFNSWARLVSGILAGLALAWFLFPYVYRSQDLSAELSRYDYGAVLEQIKKQNPHSSG